MPSFTSLPWPHTGELVRGVSRLEKGDVVFPTSLAGTPCLVCTGVYLPVGMCEGNGTVGKVFYTQPERLH